MADNSNTLGVQRAVVAAERKVASNAGLRARVQALRKRVAKKRGEPQPVFKNRGAIQGAAPGTRKLRNRGKVLEDLVRQTKG